MHSKNSIVKTAPAPAAMEVPSLFVRDFTFFLLSFSSLLSSEK